MYPIPPYSNFSAIQIDPSSSIEFQPTKMLTEKALKKCLRFTGSSFCRTMWAVWHRPQIPYRRGYNELIDRTRIIVMTLGRPGIKVFRIGKNLLGTTLGIAGTTALAPAYGIEKCVRHITGINRLDDPHEQKMALTKFFVNEMCELLRLADIGEEKRFFIENPQELIALFCIALAFFSRNEIGNELMVKNGSTINSNDMDTLDGHSKSCFKKIIELKEIIQNLNCSDWQELMENLYALLNEAPLKHDLDELQYQNYNNLDNLAHELAEIIYNDPDFQAAWNEKPNFPTAKSARK